MRRLDKYPDDPEVLASMGNTKLDQRRTGMGIELDANVERVVLANNKFREVGQPLFLHDSAKVLILEGTSLHKFLRDENA